MSELIGPVYAAKDYAGFIRRTAALLLDFAILVAVLAAIVFGWSFLTSHGFVRPPTYSRVVQVWMVLAAAYMLGFRLLPNGTPGYRLVGIRYAYMMGERPSYLWILGRSLWAVFMFWLLGLDHLWILIDKRKQAWHDKLSGFYVVKRNAVPIGTERIVRRVIGVLGYAMVVWEPAADNT